MFSKNDAEKIDEFLHNNFPQIYNIEHKGILLLYGGAIKNIVIDADIKDLDFLILGGHNNDIEQFILRNDFKYCFNIFGGYKIDYSNLKIDISNYDDLYLAGHLSTDFLFYDINRKQFFAFGINHTFQKQVIFDYYDQGFFSTNRRIKKSKKSLISLTNKKYQKKYYYCRTLQLIKTLYSKSKKTLKKIMIKCHKTKNIFRLQKDNYLIK